MILGRQNYQADIGCMSSSVNNRSLFEYMISVPDKVKIKGGKIFDKKMGDELKLCKDLGVSNQ